MNTEPRMGVDIGRVLIAGDGPDTSFFRSDEEALRVPEVEGAAEGVAALVNRFGGRVWLVSKAGPKIQRRSLEWLKAHDFYGRTGLDPEKVRFCRERSEKALHARQLGLTHFVDDRADVLRALDGVVANRFLFGPQKQRVEERNLIPVAGWRDLLVLL